MKAKAKKSVRKFLETDFHLHENPIEQFELWFDDATDAQEILPEAMALATAGKDAQPSARMVLLKSVSPEGFTFFTNYGSRKSSDMKENSKVALLFHWPRLERQVRIEGKITRTSRKESETYFASRPRQSQLGAWASPQSTAIRTRAQLVKRLEEVTRRFQGRTVPCPSNWGGFRVTPVRIEFWQGRTHRLHDRLSYYRSGKKWKSVHLAP